MDVYFLYLGAISYRYSTYTFSMFHEDKLGFVRDGGVEGLMQKQDTHRGSLIHK